jgi:copper chaperone CopZ
MVSKNTHANRYRVPAIWIMAGAALLLALTFVALRPWAGSARISSDTPAQNVQVAGTTTVSIPVEGMICVVCASSVKRTAQGIDGVREAEVDLVGRRAKVSYVEGTTSPEQIAAAIARLGYMTGPPVIEKGQ